MLGVWQRKITLTFNFSRLGSVVLLATSVLTPYFFYIPKSCLAGVIITAVIFMVEVHLVKLVWKSSSTVSIKESFESRTEFLPLSESTPQGLI